MAKSANMWLPGFDPCDGLFGDLVLEDAPVLTQPTHEVTPVPLPQPESAPVCEVSPFTNGDAPEQVVEQMVEQELVPKAAVVTSLVSKRATKSRQVRTSAPWPQLQPSLHAALNGVVTKFNANVEAIKVLREVEAAGEVPSDTQRDALNCYTGWGGIKQPFDVTVHSEWTQRALSLRNLLSEEEFESAKGSTLNAHFTPIELAQTVWSLVRKLGFNGGKVLEQSAGTGLFLGAMPSDIALNSDVTAVEIDNLTARFLKVLYGHEARVIHSGLEKANLPDDSWDLVIGNVPFGKYGVADLRRKYYSDWTIHNWMLARAVDLVRPGGLVAVITSSHFMDSTEEKRREALARRAKLVAAYRLPEGTFRSIASTEVMTDLVILQRREIGEYATPEEIAAWVPCTKLTDANGKVMRYYEHQQHEVHNVNNYWMNQRDNVLGFWKLDYGRQGVKVGVQTQEPGNVPSALETAGAMLTEVFTLPNEQEREIALQVDHAAMTDMLPGSFVVEDGEIHRTTGHSLMKQPMQPAKARRIAGLCEIRDTMRALLGEQSKVDADEDLMVRLRERMNSQYDRFVNKMGYISDKANRYAMASDPSWPLLLSLEYYDEETESAAKADIFFERTCRPTLTPTSAETPQDALAISLAELGCVDAQFIGKLLAQDPDEAIQSLMSTGDVFMDPVSGDYLAANEYLCGNVREKLNQAKDAGMAFIRNVRALEAVMPADLKPSEIDVIPGSVWVPLGDYKQFMLDLMEPELRNARHLESSFKVEYTSGKSWVVDGPWSHATTMTATWGTPRANGYELFRGLLNQTDVEVRDPDGDGGYRVNAEETAKARQKQEELKQKFIEWLWTDDARTQRLVRIYNDRYNVWAKRTYDGSRLRLPGYSNGLTLREHQLNGIMRIATGANTLLAHVVGAGKSVTMVCGSMELRRLGIAKKPVHVVPNHCLMQYTAEFMRAYPSAKVLMASKEDFEKANRQAFVARIATGNWDAIILTHSMFERISSDPEFVTDHVECLVAEIEAMKSSGDRSAQRALVRMKKDWQSRLEKMQAAWKKDNHIFFGQTGVDYIFFDEAHVAKNLARISSMKNIAGLSNSNSQRSFDLFLKTQQVMQGRAGRESGIVFASGTIPSNTLAEMHTFQRFLQPVTLAKLGLESFDAWSAQFGRVVNSLEVSPDGSSFRMNKRYKQFANLPELMGIARQAFDIQTKEMLKLPTPPLVTGAHQIAVAKPSDVVKNYVKELVVRAENIRNRKVDPSQDNMLAVTGDGMRAALDMRLLSSAYPFDENGKVAMCINNVHRIWEASSGIKGAQIVFLDIGTPTGKGFNLYEDMRRRLVAKGIPGAEIAFIHEAKTDAAKATLFAMLRSGRIRVLFGSTAKCGVGTNIQKRLIGCHHLSTPWRPSDIEQRDGRIERQGNTCDAIEIWRYVTEGTFDSYMWQVLTSKAGFIAQVLSDKAESRTVEDALMAALSYDEVKALACGNPAVREKATIDAEILSLGLKEKNYRDAQYNAKNSLWQLPQVIREAKERAVAFGKFAEEVEQSAGAPLELIVNEKRYTDREQIEKIITLSIATLVEEKAKEPVAIGAVPGGTLLFQPRWMGGHDITITSADGKASVALGSYMRGATCLEYLPRAKASVAEKAMELEGRVQYLNSQEPVLKAVIEREFPDAQRLKDLRTRSREIAMEMGLLKDMEGTQGAGDAPIKSSLASSVAESEGEGVTDPESADENEAECLLELD